LKLVIFKNKRRDKIMQKIGFKRLTETAKMPTYAHPLDDAGMDFYADEDVLICGGESEIIKTGLAWKPFKESVPKGYKVVLKIEPKSGLSCNCSIETGAGVIDQTYTGEIMIHLYNHSKEDQSAHFLKGIKIAQGIVEYIPIVEIVEVDELGITNRGAGGFGSTGEK
jgi:dUTP pyrophosphatase